MPSLRAELTTCSTKSPTMDINSAYSGTLVCKRQRMQDTAHVALQSLVDHLVLLHTALAAKALGDNLRRIVIAVAGKIADRHLGVRDAVLDQSFDVVRFHCHRLGSRMNFTAAPQNATSYYLELYAPEIKPDGQFAEGSSPSMNSGNQPSCAAFSFATEIARASPSFSSRPPVTPIRGANTPVSLRNSLRNQSTLVARDGDEIAALILAKEYWNRRMVL